MSIYQADRLHRPLTLWQDAVVRQPHNHVAHINYGVECSIAGQVGRSHRAIRRSLTLANDDFAKIHMELGTVLLPERTPTGGIPAFREGSATRTRANRPNHQFLAVSLVNAGRPADAIAHYEQACKSVRTRAEIRRKLALAFAARRSRKDAIVQFEECCGRI